MSTSMIVVCHVLLKNIHKVSSGKVHIYAKCLEKALVKPLFGV